MNAYVRSLIVFTHWCNFRIILYKIKLWSDSLKDPMHTSELCNTGCWGSFFLLLTFHLVVSRRIWVAVKLKHNENTKKEFEMCTMGDQNWNLSFPDVVNCSSFTRRASCFHIKGQKKNLGNVCLFDEMRRFGWTPHASLLSLMLPFAALESLQLLPPDSGCPQQLVCFEWDHQRAPPITFQRLFVSLSGSHRADRECFLLSSWWLHAKTASWFWKHEELHSHIKNLILSWP